MYWLLLLATAPAEPAQAAPQAQARSVDDGTAASEAGAGNRRSSSNSSQGSSVPGQEVQIGKRLATRVNGRLRTRITPDMLTQAGIASEVRGDRPMQGEQATRGARDANGDDTGVEAFATDDPLL